MWGYCCWYETVTTTSTTTTGGTGEAATWRVQNSWGTDWGDDGFITYAVEDGAGVCGLNEDVDYVVVANE